MKKNLKNPLKRAPRLENIAPDLNPPKFASDEEELQWLEDNHARLARLAEKHGIPVRFIKREPTQQISIRLPVRDIERAKEIAGSNGSYQAVLKEAVHEGLDNAAGSRRVRSAHPRSMTATG